MTKYSVANLDRMLAQIRQERVKVDDKINDECNGRFGWAMHPESNRVELGELKGQ